MTDKLNMALDDIIMKEKKSTGRGNKESRAFSKGAGRGGKRNLATTPSRAKITKRQDNARNVPNRRREEKSVMMQKDDSSFSQKRGNRQRPSQQASSSRRDRPFPSNKSRRGDNRMEVDNHPRTRNLSSKLENYEITIINDRAGRQAPPASSPAPYRSNAMDIYTPNDATSTMTNDDHRVRPTEQRYRTPQTTQGLYSSRMQRTNNGGNNNNYDSNQSIRKP